MKRLIRAFILKLLTILVACVGPVLRQASGTTKQERRRTGWQAKNILLVRLDLLGDLVFSLPVARLIKQSSPQTRITLLALPQTAELATSSPDVDAVITMDTNLVRSVRNLLGPSLWLHLSSAVRQLRSRRFDVGLSIYGRTASLLTLLSRSGMRAGFDDEAYPSALDVRVGGGRYDNRSRRHDSDLSLALVTSVYPWLLEETDVAPKLSIDADSMSAVVLLLQEAGVSLNDALVVLHAGSLNGDFKRWPSTSFAELANRLKRDGVESVLIGSESEEEMALEIASASPAVSLAGCTTMKQLLAVLKRADLIISGDSGPLHVATALGTPAIGIYGPTDPLVNGPRAWQAQPVTVIRKDIVCSPCYSVRTRGECPLYGDPICMRLVSVHEVYEAARRMLDQAKSIGAA